MGILALSCPVLQILKETSQIWNELEGGVEHTLHVPTGLW